MTSYYKMHCNKIQTIEQTCFHKVLPSYKLTSLTVVLIPTKNTHLSRTEVTISVLRNKERAFTKKLTASALSRIRT